MSALDQRTAVAFAGGLEVASFDLWPTGRREAIRPPSTDQITGVLASVSDPASDLHVLVVCGLGTSFSWCWAVCTVRGDRAVWVLATPSLDLEDLLADLGEDERALLATCGVIEIEAALDPVDDSPIDTSCAEVQAIGGALPSGGS